MTVSLKTRRSRSCIEIRKLKLRKWKKKGGKDKGKGKRDEHTINLRPKMHIQRRHEPEPVRCAIFGRGDSFVEGGCDDWLVWFGLTRWDGMDGWGFY